ncbi:hypothetical protein FF38_04945 [Lucilia cuprina]|uniref:Uncharacterized protein n=1 Tax=Lucilia cuprina TaxID=7375 RepID=A0A0L0CEU1_LUCCU|nr:hypothetical protein FF38_04945 [Lucilia cuprina]
MYVDDVLTGTHEIPTALIARDQLIAALASAGFVLRVRQGSTVADPAPVPAPATILDPVPAQTPSPTPSLTPTLVSDSASELLVLKVASVEKSSESTDPDPAAVPTPAKASNVESSGSNENVKRRKARNLNPYFSAVKGEIYALSRPDFSCAIKIFY